MDEAGEPLPAGLCELLTRSERLYERVLHLDQRMYLSGQALEGEAVNPVQSQLDKLRTAFGG